ncbi:MAG: AbrB family transcriptional regulator [Roseivivax sp.]|nr:AbrB family transcriptional regulator [Roseivivax sp.]
MTARDAALTLGLCLAGGLGGWLANRFHMPLPWMMGSLLASALLVALFQNSLLAGYRFPMRVRTGFVALIGVMIGTQVSPALIAQMAALPFTLAGIVLFVFAAHMGNYVIFRRLGGHSRATAFYAGTPGGLMESLLMGEAAGANVTVLTVQQFLRIVLVISIVPAALSLWLGAPVGSAAGVNMGGPAGPVGMLSLVIIAAVAAAGLALAQVIHLPASQLIGPLVLSGGLTLSGLVDLHLPQWLIALAQVVIGTSLGLRFRGVSAAMLRQALLLSLASVGFMLALGALLSEALSKITGIPFLHLAISFAPGGVTEMSLIALSLAANPALVSLHHVIRILLTVVEMTLMAKVMRPQEGD